MRSVLLTIPLLLLSAGTSLAQEETAVPATEKLKDSIREWIETNREIQKEENRWDQEREVLEDYREGLRVEIEDLREQIAKAKEARGAADQKSTEAVEKYEDLKGATELLDDRVGLLEEAMVSRLPLMPPPLLEDPKIGQMISDLKATVSRAEDSKPPTNTRLNTVLNLLAAAEQFQSNVRLDRDTRTVADGRELGLDVVYFGLAVAYGCDDEGKVGFVGHPGPEGWTFEQTDEIAPQVRQLVDVLNGDTGAQFTPLPIQLP